MSVVKELKERARRHGKSMEQEVRDLLTQQVRDRASVLAQIEAAWPQQKRRPAAREIDAWIRAGREG